MVTQTVRYTEPVWDIRPTWKHKVKTWKGRKNLPGKLLE